MKGKLKRNIYIALCIVGALASIDVSTSKWIKLLAITLYILCIIDLCENTLD